MLPYPLAYYAPSAARLREGVLLISLAGLSVCSSVRGSSRRVCRSLHLGFGLLLRFLVYPHPCGSASCSIERPVSAGTTGRNKSVHARGVDICDPPSFPVDT